MEPTNLSNSSDVHCVDENNELVEVHYVDEIENEKDEEAQQEAINTDDMQRTADISERDELTQLFCINGNNNRQQPSPSKQILRPAPVPGTGGHDPKGPSWKSGAPRVICHNCYQNGNYASDFTLKFREYPTIFLNYEKLIADDKACVRTTSKNQA